MKDIVTSATTLRNQTTLILQASSSLTFRPLSFPLYLYLRNRFRPRMPKTKRSRSCFYLHMLVFSGIHWSRLYRNRYPTRMTNLSNISIMKTRGSVPGYSFVTFTQRFPQNVPRYYDGPPDQTAALDRTVCKHCGAEGEHKTSACTIQIVNSFCFLSFYV